MSQVWAEPLLVRLTSALGQGKALTFPPLHIPPRYTSSPPHTPLPYTPPPFSPLPYTLLPIRISCPICYVANGSWPSVELVSWHLISPLCQDRWLLRSQREIACPFCACHQSPAPAFESTELMTRVSPSGLQAHLALSSETAFCPCCSHVWCPCQDGLWRTQASVIAYTCLLSSSCFDLGCETE